jgi:regulator of nonsense transcripts 2
VISHLAAAEESEDSSDESEDDLEREREKPSTARIDDGDSEDSDDSVRPRRCRIFGEVPPPDVLSLLLSTSQGAADSDGEGLSVDDAEEDLVVRNLAKDTITQEEEDEFNKEFAKLLVDTTDGKKSDRKVTIPVFDTAVPLMRRAKPAGGYRGAVLDEDPVVVEEAKANSMKFMLLTKKGNKPQVRLALCNCFLATLTNRFSCTNRLA